MSLYVRDRILRPAVYPDAPPGPTARRAGPAGAAQFGQEIGQPGEIGLLVVVHGHVAPLRAVQVAAGGQRGGHLLHVGRVHGVVAGADDQGRDVNRGQVSAAVPVRELRVGADPELAGTLHGHVDGRVDV